MKGLMKDILFGMAIGDALGVPVEFSPRKTLDSNPVTDMMGHKVHNQPIGTWSDDSSMAFCMVESLINGYNPNDMGENFVNWAYYGLWTPHGEVFDIGNTTISAIERLKLGYIPPILCGGANLNHNGNGSVMRMLPMVAYMTDLRSKTTLDSMERYNLVANASSLTHRHWISIVSCHILCEYGLYITHLRGKMAPKQAKIEAFSSLRPLIEDIITQLPCTKADFYKNFEFLINNTDFKSVSRDVIRGSGYAIHTLEASIWCLLNTDSYEEAVLMAVNLGEDTDTTGCVTGGLAGLLYGSATIPQKWMDLLVKKDEINDLIERYEARQ